MDRRKVEISDTGSGVPLVFVPSLAGSRDWYCYQISGLSDHYRVISCDLRRARPRRKYTAQLLADDLSKLLATLRVPRAVLAGHSFGGLIALQFALSYPEQCLALVLSSTAPSYHNIPAEDLIADQLPGEVKFDNLLAKLLRLLGRSGNPSEDDTGQLACLMRSASGLDRATLDSRVSIMHATDYTPSLREITIPTLIVAGSEEKPYVLGGAQRLHEGIQNPTLEVLEAADHYGFYTRHDLFNAVVAEFLRHQVTRL